MESALQGRRHAAALGEDLLHTIIRQPIVTLLCGHSVNTSPERYDDGSDCSTKNERSEQSVQTVFVFPVFEDS